MKLAVAIVDTEGGMMRLGKQHSLWNVCFLFSNVINTKTYTSTKLPCNHNITYTSDKDAENIGRDKPVVVLVDSIRYVLETVDADGVVAICWNKSHDRRMLEHIDFGFPMYFVDGIDIHKQLRPRYRGNNKLETLTKLYKIAKKQRHTALRDCVDTEQVLVHALNHVMKDDKPRDLTHVLNHGIFRTLLKKELAKPNVPPSIQHAMSKMRISPITIPTNSPTNSPTLPTNSPTNSPTKGPTIPSTIPQTIRTIPIKPKNKASTNTTTSPKKSHGCGTPSNSPSNSPKKSPSNSLKVKDNYEYFEFDNNLYKMRKGWSINRHKNFGLYRLDENQTYKSIRGDAKDEILHNVWFTTSTIYRSDPTTN